MILVRGENQPFLIASNGKQDADVNAATKISRRAILGKSFKASKSSRSSYESHQVHATLPGAQYCDRFLQFFFISSHHHNLSASFYDQSRTQ